MIKTGLLLSKSGCVSPAQTKLRLQVVHGWYAANWTSSLIDGIYLLTFIEPYLRLVSASQPIYPLLLDVDDDDDKRTLSHTHHSTAHSAALAPPARESGSASNRARGRSADVIFVLAGRRRHLAIPRTATSPWEKRV